MNFNLMDKNLVFRIALFSIGSFSLALSYERLFLHQRPNSNGGEANSSRKLNRNCNRRTRSGIGGEKNPVGSLPKAHQ